jgi:hypothetical protein
MPRQEQCKFWEQTLTIAFVIINYVLSYVFFARCRNRKLILLSYHEVYTFMLRVTCVTGSNECHDRNNVSFESRRWLLHLLSSIMCCLTFFARCRNRKFILVSYRKDYTFMLRVTCVTFSNECHDRNNVSFESRRWLLHLLSSIMCCLTFFGSLSQQEVYVGFIPRRLYFHASSYMCNI